VPSSAAAASNPLCRPTPGLLRAAYVKSTEDLLVQLAALEPAFQILEPAFQILDPAFQILDPALQLALPLRAPRPARPAPRSRTIRLGVCRHDKHWTHARSPWW